MKNGKIRAVLLIGIVLAMALALSACGSDDSTSGTTAADTSATTESSGGDGGRLGILLENARNDKSFGQASYEGAQEAADELGLELTVVDNVTGDIQKAQKALQSMVGETDYMVMGATALVGGMPQVAEQNPDKQFGIYLGPIEGPENLHWAWHNWYSLAYLAGVAAAESSASGTVGYIGGMEIPPTMNFEAGYKAGAEASGAKVVSTITNDFEDTTKAKDAASAQIAQGADVIYAFLDAAHLGVVEAAKESGDTKVMGVIVPKCDISDGLDIGDAIIAQDKLVSQLVHAMVEEQKEDIIYGIQDPEVARFEFCPGADPAVEKAVGEARQEFLDGTLEVPEEWATEDPTGH